MICFPPSAVLYMKNELRDTSRLDVALKLLLLLTASFPYSQITI